MLSQNPLKCRRINVQPQDIEFLRLALISELDAINLYEQMANVVQNPSVKKVLLHIAKEEKTHVGELQTLVLTLDSEQNEEMVEGRKEVVKEIGETV